MKIIICHQTKNPCFIKAEPMTPKGIVVHSTGANNPNLKRYVDCEAELGKNQYGNHWNQGSAQKMVHAFIGKDKAGNVAVVNTLPYDMACWGVGRGRKGSYNYDPTGHIQFEMCEDNLTDKGYFQAVIQAAEEYCAYLCREFHLPVSSIVSHKEAHAQGYGSNHGDPHHWLSKFGMTMDDFRQAVEDILAPKPAPAPETVYTVVKGDSLSKIAARYSTTWQKLAAYNGLTNPSLIHVGQKIKIPGTAPSAPSKPRTYTVVAGDSLSRIGNRLGVSWRKIATANGIKFPWIIRPGQVLTIPEV